MKQQKAMLIALIVICLTVIVTALVTRKDLCEVRVLSLITHQRCRPYPFYQVLRPPHP
ncbi:Hok/Gef family protein [Escherichia coli]|uniref:Hok/Gef family protein n=1 Tax=Escherichia coli TaxID=562 RepID=UPI00207644EE|nr:Hok/Gef family protein [Escherichia coli]